MTGSLPAVGDRNLAAPADTDPVGVVLVR